MERITFQKSLYGIQKFRKISKEQAMAWEIAKALKIDFKIPFMFFRRSGFQAIYEIFEGMKKSGNMEKEIFMKACWKLRDRRPRLGKQLKLKLK